MPIPLSSLTDKKSLYKRGVFRVRRFCDANRLELPVISVIQPSDWHFDVCAFYRPDGIRICLEYCGRAAVEQNPRNWSWPGSVTDREPYGVLCHELGHHADWTVSEKKGRYYGEYGINVGEESGEPPITSYAPNPAEWFAEMFRLFVTNSQLLKLLRPKTYRILSERWVPVSDVDWVKELGENVPPRIIRNLVKKVNGAR